MNTKLTAAEALSRYEDDAPKRKRVFPKGDFASIFLPSPVKVGNLLGFKLSGISQLKLLERKTKIPIPMSKSSLYAIFSKGASKRSANILDSWLIDIDTQLNLKVEETLFEGYVDAGMTKSNAAFWLPLIDGLSSGSEAADKLGPNIFDVLSAFIRQRSELDTQLMGTAREALRNRSLTAGDDANFIRLCMPYWSKSPIITEDDIEHLAQQIELRDSEKLANEANTLDALHVALKLHLDFYLQAVASFELGYRFVAVEKAREASDPGFISRILTEYLDQDSERQTIFSAFLSCLKAELSTLGLAPEWSTLIACCPITYKDDEAPSDSDIKVQQSKRFSDWRCQGPDKQPSLETFREFLDNLFEKAQFGGAPDKQVLYLIGTFCRGLDALIAKDLIGIYSQTAKEEKQLRTHISQILSLYPHVYSHLYRKNLRAAECRPSGA